MIGPAIPSHLKRENKDDSTCFSGQDTEKPISPTSNSVIGPSLPGASVKTQNAPVVKKRIGPQLPPEIQRAQYKPPSPKMQPALESSDDELIGPLPPNNNDLKASALDSKLAEICNRAQLRKKNEDNTKRGDWMTILPEARSAGDPLKSIARQFKRSNAPVNDGDRSLWTETPEQRAERLKGNSSKSSEQELYKNYPSKRAAEQEESISNDINMYNMNNRSKSLMELHQESLSKKRVKKGTQDDPDHPSNNRFDRERDMSIKTLDPRRQHEMLKNAGNLSDRFARGSESKYE